MSRDKAACDTGGRGVVKSLTPDVMIISRKFFASGILSLPALGQLSAT